MTTLQGKTVLVTGATAGIGLVTARRLAALGAHTILVGRDDGRLATALETIRAAVPGASVDSLRADLSLMAEVRSLANRFLATGRPLDVLVNNAGALFATRRETSEGLEMTFALNHMSYFLLSNLLRPALEAAAAARVVNVSSEAHRQGRVDFDDLQGRKRYAQALVYGNTKLMNILFTREFARRLAGTRVTTNSLHPGFVDSNFGENERGVTAVLIKMAKVFAITPEAGAETSVFLASDESVAEVTGEYFVRKRRKVPNRAARDDVAAGRLWDESARMAGL